MIRMGDEFLQTQNGNANPYNVDDLTTWLDWSKVSSHADMLRFTRMLIGLRNKHPSICRSRFWREDVSWYGPNGAPDFSPSSHTIAYIVHGASAQDKDIYVLANMYWQDLNFALAEPGPWTRVLDTSLESPNDIGSLVPIPGANVNVRARSVVVAVHD
jgi:isoamylase